MDRKKLVIKKIVNGKLKQNCYLVTTNSKKTIIIDPGGEYNKIKEYLTRKEFTPIAIFGTHAHFDHIGCVNEIKNYYKIPFFLHSFDLKLLNSMNLYINVMNKLPFVKVPKVDFLFDCENNLPFFDENNMKIYHTPGHTKGSICILINNILFSGDTVLWNKIGRYDLPGGNKKCLVNSIKMICDLPNEMIILPGHGKQTVLKKIKSNLLKFIKDNDCINHEN